MWALVRQLNKSGVTIILTTHYIDEAEEMADRIGVISRGKLMLVEDKATLRRLGELGIAFKDLNTQQSSLEDIFVSLVSDRNGVHS